MKRALTPTQASALLQAVSTLPPASRDGFLTAVDARLCGVRHRVTDAEVNAAIVAVLADASITTTAHFMCDASPKEPIMAAIDDDDDPFDERGILKDGRVARISLQMRDAALVRRRGFDDSACLHRPGPVYCDRSAALEAYADAVRESEQAWKSPAPDAVRGQQPGDLCTINGAPGHLNARLECVPDTEDRRRKRKGVSRDPFGRETGSWEEEEDGLTPDRQDARPTFDAAEGRRRKAAAYNAMCAEMCDAWKDPSR